MVISYGYAVIKTHDDFEHCSIMLSFCSNITLILNTAILIHIQPTSLAITNHDSWPALNICYHQYQMFYNQ